MATRTFEAAVYTARGTARERMALPADLFDGTVHEPVMHQAVKAYLANQRQGNAQTKTRGFVAGGNQKPWRQKGTGRARQGSIRAPNWVGGGTVFGPIPRAYDQYVPRQVRQLARKSAFNARAREEAIYVIDAFTYDAPGTKQLVALLDRLELGDRKTLILTDGVKPNVYLSGRNLPNVHVMPYRDVSTYHLLWSDVVLIEAPALGQRFEPVAEEDTAEAPKRARKAAPKREAAEPAAKKTSTKKRATKKAAAKKTTRSAAGKSSAAKKTGAKKKTAAKKGGTKKKGK